MENEKLKFKEKIQDIITTECFQEIYVVILLCTALLGWKFNMNAGLIVIAVFGILMLFITQDLKFTIPNVVYLLFAMSKGFSSDVIPYDLIIIGSVFLIVLIIFAFKNEIKIDKCKSLVGLLGCGISTLIPLFWFKLNDKSQVMFYFLYFCDLIYFLIYFIFVNGIKTESKSILVKTMSYLGVLISLEIVLYVQSIRQPNTNIYSLIYYLGWGLCNEAGIMICFSLPFTFYLMAKSKNPFSLIYNNLKIILLIIGIALTTSRGSYMCGTIICLTSFGALFFVSEKKKQYSVLFTVVFITLFILYMIFSKNINSYLKNAYETVFEGGLDSNGRTNLYKEAWNIFTTSPINTIFGAGYCATLRVLTTAEGTQIGEVVYHSTFFQTLVVGGLIGLVFMIIHFYEKYRQIFKIDYTLFVFLLIGYIFVDMYGFIDNTYHMYYYMIPLVLVIAALDSDIYINKKEKEKMMH